MNWYNRIWTLAWPIILSNVTLPLLGMVDIAVVGHQSDSNIMAAVAIGSMLFDIIFWAFGFLRMSTTGFIAQQPSNDTLLYQSLYLSISLALLITVLQSPLFQVSMYLFNPDSKVQTLLSQYFHWRIYASLPTLLNYVLLGYFFGRQNTRLALLITLLINCSAIFLDIVLVRYLCLGVKGLAIANIVAQSLGTSCGLLAIYFLYKPKPFILSSVLDLVSIKKLFHLNKDIFIRTLCLMGTLAYFTYSGSKLGASIVAANAVLLSMHHLVSYGLDGFAIACEALVGESLGKKNKRHFLAVINHCFIFSFIVAALFSFVFIAAGPFIIKLITSVPNVVTIANQHIYWVIALPLLSVSSYVLDGIFIGATWSSPMRNTMLISSLVIFFPATFLFRSWHNNGLWMAFSLFMLARGFSLFLVLKHNISKMNTACVA